MNLKLLDNGLEVLVPNWVVPKHIHAFISTRIGGVSDSPYNSLNLGTHVGDNIEHVLENRKLIRQVLPNDPLWLNQVHGCNIWTPCSPNIDSDGALTFKNDVLAIMTADCMPLLFCDEDGDFISACHAGWRGLSNGVIQQTIKQMLLGKGADQANLYLSKIKAYIGPSIGPKHFEVGVDVYQSFVNKLSQNQMNQCFVNGQNQGKYFANLFQIARNVLSGLGIEQIFTEEICCYENKNLFFSHRRDKQSGRFGSFIWKEDL